MAIVMMRQNPGIHTSEENPREVVVWKRWDKLKKIMFLSFKHVTEGTASGIDIKTRWKGVLL